MNTTLDCLELVQITRLMPLTEGRSDVVIGLIDGPIAIDHPDFSIERIRQLPQQHSANCNHKSSCACRHGTFVAGILAGKRNSSAPAICPGCTLLVRPIFVDGDDASCEKVGATAEELASALLDCIEGGARVINLSLAFTTRSIGGIPKVEAALDLAIKHDVLVVLAAGNQGRIGASALARHPWVIPVVACDRFKNPLPMSNLGEAIGKRGLCSLGEGVTSLGVQGTPVAMGGTSVAAPFVTGTIALLWSIFPAASSAEIKDAVVRGVGRRRTSIVPPLLNAWGAYSILASRFA